MEGVKTQEGVSIPSTEVHELRLRLTLHDFYGEHGERLERVE